MKIRLSSILLVGLLTAGCILLSSFRPARHAVVLKLNPKVQLRNHNPEDKLKKEALEILQSKCNICHRKKNPFMVFNERNMAKRAPKIYKMVVVERRMPKGSEIRLTNEEFTLLEKWLLTQNIY